MGERKLAPGKALKAVSAACRDSVNGAVEAADESMQVRTPGGVFSVRWDQRASATALGQLAFFAEYLEATGLFERWLKSCPLSYTSPNAPELVDVLGTWMLSILDGHCRYAHVGALRGDGVAPSILGMNRIIGDDSLRRALGGQAQRDAAHRAGSATCTLDAVDAGPAQAQHCAGDIAAVDLGLRHDDQAVVRQARRGGRQL